MRTLLAKPPLFSLLSGLPQPDHPDLVEAKLFGAFNVRVERCVILRSLRSQAGGRAAPWFASPASSLLIT
jgi:hypothetical protein